MVRGASEIGSAAWCAAISEVLVGVELPEVRAIVEQRIGDGNGGSVVAYRLVLADGRAHLEPVPEAGGAGAGEAPVAGDSRAGEAPGAGDSRAGEAPGAGGGGDSVVVMSQSRETAAAVRRGELGALAALQAGLITVSGDVRVLIAASEALAAVDAALGAALAGDHDGNDSEERSAERTDSGQTSDGQSGGGAGS